MLSKISQQVAEAGVLLHAFVVYSLPFSCPTDARQPSSEFGPCSDSSCILERRLNYGLIRCIVFKSIYSELVISQRYGQKDIE